jgi:serine/threonine-protein kinase RsbW
MTHTFSMQLRAAPEALTGLRRELLPFLQEVFGDDPEAVSDLLLACSEAVANAIEHPRGRRDGVIDVVARVVDHQVVLSVHDNGQWRDEQTSDDRGRGFVLMHQLADVSLERRVDGTTITMRRPLHR